MQTLCRVLWELPEYQELLRRLKAGYTPVALGGLSRTHTAHVIAALRRDLNRPVAILCSDEMEAAALLSDIAVMTGEEGAFLPTREFIFYPVESASREWEHKRLAVFSGLSAGTVPFVAGPTDAFLQRTLLPDSLSVLHMKPGKKLDPGALMDWLTTHGYARGEQVEGAGQCARRGGIVDVFAPTENRIVRVDFFGDEIDSLAAVDLASQRRISDLASVFLCPAREVLPNSALGGLEGLLHSLDILYEKERRSKMPREMFLKSLSADRERLAETGTLPHLDRYLEIICPTFATALNYMPSETIYIVCERGRIADRVTHAHWRAGEDAVGFLSQGVSAGALARLGGDITDLWRLLKDKPLVYADSLAGSQYELPPREILHIPASTPLSYGGHLETAAEDIEHHLRNGNRIVVALPGERRIRILNEILTERGISATIDCELSMLPQPGTVALCRGGLSAGIEYPALRFMILTEGQILPAARKARRTTKLEKHKRRISSYTDLTPGDAVVHDHHGIGRFAGIVSIECADESVPPPQRDPLLLPKPVTIKKDYIKIEYAGTDVLYVPVTQLHLVAKYIGVGEDAQPRPMKLGGTEWHRAKSRARASAKELAAGMVALYAERLHRAGYAFPTDDDWQREFEDAFEHDETEDQLTCAREIKNDMEQPTPMDRLLCGDVGFGKTEVALRAVMKCVLGGKQAALLVPTTVLAQQHFLTAARRFSRYPIRVDMISRFRTPAQIRETLRKLETGSLDLIIGTHRLLQKDINFSNLGLLIIDEEQRFGVGHKEKIKELFRQVDVLTLTATPIPRTLNMALSGIRDMSTLEDPPRDRMPVQTYVLEYDESLIVDSIRREIARGGQVYYLYNRVDSIERAAARLQEKLPEAQISVAHGQMGEDELGEAMIRMAEGSIQVLVCSTIIETGIDIPNVNTLIIEEADKLGLAQLHQIRGRVGRASRRAFAYLTYRRGKVLSEIATRRLSAIRDFTEFGSGFRIAMRDLEIRGAGNVLGAEQSGHLTSVGYDMYLRLLEEAVLEEKSGHSEEATPPVLLDCVADLPISASIPTSYVASAGQRMDLYRRIAAIGDEEDAYDLIDEIIDRFGSPPIDVQTLVEVALLRAAAAKLGISEIAVKGGRLICKLNPSVLDFGALSLLSANPDYRRKLVVGASDPPHVALKLTSGENVLDTAKRLTKVWTEARLLSRSAATQAAASHWSEPNKPLNSSENFTVPPAVLEAIRQ